MPLLRQLEFAFRTVAGIGDPGILRRVGKAGVTDPPYNDGARQTTAREY
jgi:hypothetical protein